VHGGTEIIVTMAGEGSLTCGGRPMVPLETAETTTFPVALPGVTLIGRRYHAPDRQLQVLCTRQGPGTLELDGKPLELIKPKLLPASD
jgi:hypothetical protein